MFLFWWMIMFGLGYVCAKVRPLRFVTGFYWLKKALLQELADVKAQLGEAQGKTTPPAPPPAA